MTPHRGIDKEVLRELIPKKTKVWVWIVGVMVLVSTLFVIGSMVALLVIKPTKPCFDINRPVPSIRPLIWLGRHCDIHGMNHLSSNDFEVLAIFKNDNKRVRVSFQRMEISILFKKHVIASRYIQPFSLGKKETRSVPFRLTSTTISLSVKEEAELQLQMRNNRTWYEIKGKLTVISSLGRVHHTYTMVERCEPELSAPPAGNLISRSCGKK